MSVHLEEIWGCVPRKPWCAIQTLVDPCVLTLLHWFKTQEYLKMEGYQLFEWVRRVANDEKFPVAALIQLNFSQ